MRFLKMVSVCLFSVSGCAANTGLSSMTKENQITSQNDTIKYRDEMRNFVIKISEYAKSTKPNFAIIPQNGIELVTLSGEISGSPSTAYLKAIDANGQESLFYGYNGDNKATPKDTKDYTVDFLNVSKANGNTILVTDYCYSAHKVSESYSKNAALGFVSFAAPERDLNLIPNKDFPIFNENTEDILTIKQAKNFLYLLNLENFDTKSEFLSAIQNTNYDVILIDLFFNDGQQFTSEEILKLKTKANGSGRLVLAYMSIGEAEEYRFYWQKAWKNTNPLWLDKENQDWKGNFKVKYWNADWQKIILGSENAYLDKILNANFDGVYLDIIDGFEYFEEE